MIASTPQGPPNSYLVHGCVVRAMVDGGMNFARTHSVCESNSWSVFFPSSEGTAAFPFALAAR